MILDKLERKYGRYVPENITNILLAGQVIGFVLTYTSPEFASYFYLTGAQLLQGEAWRVLFLLFTPVSTSPLFAIFALYFLYIFGRQLESQWGSFRYLVYILISYLAITLFALLFPQILASNMFLYTSLFLAYAYLFPETPVLLFFILPIKVKWLGYFTWFSLIMSFLSGPLEIKTLILFSNINFFIFFGSDLKYSLRSILGGSIKGALGPIKKKNPQHVCAICGDNEIDNPDMEIRYCSQCVPTTCYCGKHVFNHQHKRVVN